jgi:glycosyltransferase involved in cell wall biosynthesis
MRLARAAVGLTAGRRHAAIVARVRSRPRVRIVLEAIVRGRAVVATRVGGMSELIDDGHTGWLIKLDDPKALADRLIDVLSSCDAATAMGALGSRRAEARNPAAEYSAGIARLADWIASG